MKSIIKAVIKAIGFIVFLPVTSWLVEIENAAPGCCGEKSSFVGSHTSLFEEALFYQCDKCQKIKKVDNPHEGIGLWRIWRVFNMPKMGRGDE